MKAGMEESRTMRAGDQREKLQAEYLNMTKKRNSAVQRYAGHLQVKVIQALFGTKNLSSTWLS